jgi:hypothetical protein
MTYRGDSKGGASVSLYHVTYMQQQYSTVLQYSTAATAVAMMATISVELKTHGVDITTHNHVAYNTPPFGNATCRGECMNRGTVSQQQCSSAALTCVNAMRRSDGCIYNSSH